MGVKDQKFEIDYYFVFKSHEFSFYILFKFEAKINLGMLKISFSFEFYIYPKLLAGLKYE